MGSNRNQSHKEAETQELAVDVLSWIASDGEMMSRFLAISGLSVDNLRAASSEPGFLAGVLGFLMAHEPTLLAYCSARDIDPETVVEAWRELGGEQPFEGST
ncbi:DUF3572 domain-containing protein [Nitratireductor sp. XY-223]|uniref:DUF3572 domain-containing protein n=1 Tax=Nitratireductor sp. XY-223 TaxID=2561926 RepID=UPI001FEE51D3|nr:DUF3572 domain-containing protein [Nitratireductor sp. XY-223]